MLNNMDTINDLSVTSSCTPGFATYPNFKITDIPTTVSVLHFNMALKLALLLFICL